MRRFTATVAALMIALAHVHAEAPAKRPASIVGVQPIRDAVSREASRLARTSRPASPPQPQATHQRNWFARHPVLTGTMVGAGVGLAFAAAEGCDSSDFSCGAIVGFLVGTGAALGAAGGLIAAAFIH